MIRQLLRMEGAAAAELVSTGSARTLFVSLNADLVSDFGHFLNYELRIEEECHRLGLGYLCLANEKTSVAREALIPAFKNDSGYYSLVRASAQGKEASIAREFQHDIERALAERWRQYETVILFVYCGSSLLASHLSYLEFPPNVRLVVNAFWDFLLPPHMRDYDHLHRIKFQRDVQVLAMSELHAREISLKTGLYFPACRNPSPLLGDEEAYGRLRATLAGTSAPAHLQVLVPGLMTNGKGKDATIQLHSECTSRSSPEAVFCFRDRSGALPATTTPRVRVVRGDLTDAQVIDLYSKSSIAILPYEPSAFAVRTSGALVDCLMFGVVPIVLDDTWLADVCRRYEFGAVVETSDAARVLREVDRIGNSLEMELRKVSAAAVRYFCDQNWSAFVKRACGEAVPSARKQHKMDRASSLFAAGNMLQRSGRHREAVQVYSWLAASAEFIEYSNNMKRSRMLLGDIERSLDLDQQCAVNT